jgi:hypothetical protein
MKRLSLSKETDALSSATFPLMNSSEFLPEEFVVQLAL